MFLDDAPLFFFSARLCLLVSCCCPFWAYSARRRPLVLVLGTQCRCRYSVYISLLVRSLPCSSCWRPSVSSCLGAVVPSFRLAGAATFSLSPSACVSPPSGPSWWSLLYSVASPPPLLRFLQMSPVNSPPKAWEFFTLKAVVWADVALFAKDDVSECWVVSKE